MELCELAGSSEGYAASATLIAAVQKSFPRYSLRTSWKVLEVWRSRYPAQQALPMPFELGLALANWLVLAERPRIGCGVLFCLAGLLRASEALGVVGERFVAVEGGYVIVLLEIEAGLL